MHTSSSLIAAVGVVSVFSTAAMAQSAGGLEEVVVTAQKRAESVQSTPIVVTAVNADELAKAGVQQVEQLGNLVPAVEVQQTTGAPAMYIRGINAVGQGSSIEQPAAVYLNGAYLPRAQAYNGQFFDVERMEILLGPQGTLYGRNAVTGVMNIISRQPGKEFSADGDLEVGEYNLLRAEAAVTLPMTDSFSTRIAARRHQRDGYFKNGLGDVGEDSARATLRYAPDDHQVLTVIGDWEKIDNRNQDGRGGSSAASIYSSPNANVVMPPRYNNDFAYGDGDYSFNRSTQYGVTAQYDNAFDHATLTVLGSYRHLRSDSLAYDGYTLTRFGTVSDVTLTDSIVNFDLRSLEARLTSTDAGPLKWVVGGYWLSQSNNGGINSFQSATPAAAYASYQTGVPGLAFSNPVDRGEAYALFADATWTPASLERLHLTGGARYSKDRKEGITVFEFPPADETSVGGGKRHWNAFTWRLIPSFDLTDNSMVYASVSHGYEAGGFAFAPSGEDSAYKPQYLAAYELGSKNQLLDNRLRLNADVYYYDYTDKQQIYAYAGVGGPRIGVTNYDAKYWGGSITLEAWLTRADVISVDGAYAKGESGGLLLSRYSPSLTDVPKGEQLRDVSPFTANASYRHEFDLGRTTLAPQLAYHFKQYATQKQSTGGNSALTSDAYIFYKTPNVSRWDLLLSWADVGRRWEATAYVRNVTNQYSAAMPLLYTAATQDSNGPFGAAAGNAEYFGISPMAPRTAGVMLHVNF